MKMATTAILMIARKKVLNQSQMRIPTEKKTLFPMIKHLLKIKPRAESQEKIAR